MHDAHFHMSTVLFAILRENHLVGIASCDKINKLQKLQMLQQSYPFYISCGIHPWYIDEVSYSDMEPYLKQVDFIGEIGLDCIWCSTNLQKQKEVFEYQLRLAKQYHKPVILHLKGMEKEALSYIKKYPNRYLVHWYSCLEYLQSYIDLDCYFTVGPSVVRDKAVRNVAKYVPINRLLLESDGIEAIAWAENCQESEVDYIATLKQSLRTIAQLRQMDISVLEKQVDENFVHFIKYRNDIFKK